MLLAVINKMTRDHDIVTEEEVTLVSGDFPLDHKVIFTAIGCNVEGHV